MLTIFISPGLDLDFDIRRSRALESLFFGAQIVDSRRQGGEAVDTRFIGDGGSRRVRCGIGYGDLNAWNHGSAIPGIWDESCMSMNSKPVRWPLSSVK